LVVQAPHQLNPRGPQTRVPILRRIAKWGPSFAFGEPPYQCSGPNASLVLSPPAAPPCVGRRRGQKDNWCGVTHLSLVVPDLAIASILATLSEKLWKTQKNDESRLFAIGADEKTALCLHIRPPLEPNGKTMFPIVAVVGLLPLQHLVGRHLPAANPSYDRAQ